MAKDHLSSEELFSHVQDAPFFHMADRVAKLLDPDGAHGHVEIPQPFATPVADAEGHVVHNAATHMPVYEPVWYPQTGIDVVDEAIQPMDFVITKFMVIEVIVAAIIVVVFTWLARRMRGGAAPKGRFWNFLEAILLFVRDKIARPAIGHDADKYMPFLWTLFFFILGCNVIGMVPWMGTPTGALAVTGVLALTSFGVVLATGFKRLGFVGFWKAQVPHMDLAWPIKIVLAPLIWVIEVFGLFVKHGVLAMRLLANMMAGHLVLAVLVGFIGATANLAIWWGVMPLSVLGATALSILELFVACLQTYIFVFLTALFIGAASHAH